MSYSESSSQEEFHPLDRGINFWIRRNPNYKKILIEGKLVPPFIKSAKLCISDKKFLEDQSEPFVDGWVIFCEGISKDDPRKVALGEQLFKPMLDRIITYLLSDNFKKYVLNQHISGEEKVPISIPEIFITVNELLLFSKRERLIIVTKENISKLKQNFVLDKIQSWGLDGEFGKKIKELEFILYPEIFYPEGYLVFQKIMDDQVTEGRGIHSDIAFFYHKLNQKGLIHAKEEKFKTWFERIYPSFPTLGKFHSLDRIKETNSRKERLSIALDSIKSR